MCVCVCVVRDEFRAIHQIIIKDENKESIEAKILLLPYAFCCVAVWHNHINWICVVIMSSNTFCVHWKSFCIYE